METTLDELIEQLSSYKEEYGGNTTVKLLRSGQEAEIAIVGLAVRGAHDATAKRAILLIGE